MTYYLIEVESGVEAFARGPYETDGQRDNAARQLRESQEDDASLFWADVDESGALRVGSYGSRFFSQHGTSY